nr:reverse transcriptase domain-containing protein [Tanacetum cinerariifolium]
MGDEHLDTILATESNELIKSSVENHVPIPSKSEGIPDTMCDVHLVTNPTPLEAKDHFEIEINSNDDYSSSDDDSLYNENIEYVEASPHDSELVSLEVAEIVIPEDEEIEDDNLCEKLLKVNLLIAKIKTLKDNSTPPFKFLTKSSSTFPKSVLEETSTFDDSLPEFKIFCFDLEEISSGSTTTHSDISLSGYEAFSFYDSLIEEISSGSITTHSDISLFEYNSFIFDLSNEQCPPTDRSDFTHEEFADKLAHIISPLEYDCFYFGNLPDPGEWISSLNSRTRENLSSTTCVNLPVEDDHSPLLAYVVWIFLAYLTVENDDLVKNVTNSRKNKEGPGMKIHEWMLSVEMKLTDHYRMYAIMFQGLNEITQKVLNVVAGGIFLYKTPNQAYQLLEDKFLLMLDWAKYQKTKSSLKKAVALSAEDVIDKILEEDFDALLDEGSEILHFIEGTILEEKLFVEFDEFMVMTADENSESKSDTEEPPFEKITFNSDYRIKTSLKEPPTDLELKPLPDYLEYVFLEEPSFLPVIVSSHLFDENKNKLEKCHFMVKEEIVLRHKVSKAGLEVDKAKIKIKNNETSDDSKVNDNFPGETLMEMNTEDEPCFADFANYLVSVIIPKGMTYR